MTEVSVPNGPRESQMDSAAFISTLNVYRKTSCVWMCAILLSQQVFSSSISCKHDAMISARGDTAFVLLVRFLRFS